MSNTQRDQKAMEGGMALGSEGCGRGGGEGGGGRRGGQVPCTSPEI